MEFTRRQVAAAGATALGGAFAGDAFWQDELECPEPNDYAWEVDAGDLGTTHMGNWGPPILGEDAVYVTEGHGIIAGGEGTVACVDRDSGAVRWTVNRDPAGFGTPNPVGDVVYVPTGQNELLAVGRSDGTVRWRVGAGGSYGGDSGDSYALAKPVATDSEVVVQAFQGSTAEAFEGEHAVAGVDATTGDVAWTHSFGARGRPVDVGNGDVVVVCEDGALRRLDAASGAVRWRASVDPRPMPEESMATVVPVDATPGRIDSSVEDAPLLLLDEAGTLFGVDAADGTVAWSASLVPPGTESERSVPPVPNAAVGGDVVVAATNGGAIVGHDLHTGERRFQYRTTAPVIDVDVHPGEAVVVGFDERGIVHVLDVDDGLRADGIATAPTNYGDSCGWPVKWGYPETRYVAVAENAAYVSAHWVRRFALPA
jgi:outer membrane protein assembly factor BamB